MQISKTVDNGSANQTCVLLKTSAKITLSELKGQLTLSVTQLNVNQSYLLNQNVNCLNINGTVLNYAGAITSLKFFSFIHSAIPPTQQIFLPPRLLYWWSRE